MTTWVVLDERDATHAFCPTKERAEYYILYPTAPFWGSLRIEERED